MKQYLADQDLVLLARAGDLEAFEKLVARYQQAVFRTAYRLLGSREEAEDVAQEAFLRCYQKLHRYDTRFPFAPWLYRIATNLALSRLRRARKWSLVPWQENPARPENRGEADDPAATWERKELQRELALALQNLAPRDRAALFLRYFEELSYEEIAYVLGTTRNNVEVRLSRARRKLRSLLSPAGRPGPGVKPCLPVEK